MKERRRRASKGIIIYSILLIIFGSLNFISIIASLVLLNFQDSVMGIFSFMPQSTLNSSLFWVSTIVSMFIMLCWVVSGAGMLSLKEWARQAFLASMGIYFLNSFFNIILNVFMVQEFSNQLPVAYLVIGIVFVLSLSVSMVYFFTHPKVVFQFQQRTKATLR